MRYKLAIFDMDGTILNTLEDLKDSLNVTLKKFNMPTRNLEDTRKFVGNGIRKLIERAVPSGTTDKEIDEIFAEFMPYYNEHCKDKTKPYDGICELLPKLRNAGIKTAVVSNKADAAVQILVDDFFKGMFDYAVGEKEGIRKKPSPDSVNAVIDKLKEKKSDTVYIGDSDVDLQTAINSGVDEICVTWGFRDREFMEEKGAKVFVNNTDELEKMLIE